MQRWLCTVVNWLASVKIAELLQLPIEAEAETGAERPGLELELVA